MDRETQREREGRERDILKQVKSFLDFLNEEREREKEKEKEKKKNLLVPQTLAAADAWCSFKSKLKND